MNRQPLAHVSWDLKMFGVDSGSKEPPYRLRKVNQSQVGREVGVARCHLYSIEGDAIDYIMDTFPIVRRKDEKAHGKYRTKRVILEIYDQMAEAIRTGQPYQTWLDPPPGPPTDAEGNFIPMSDWDPDNWPPHIHPPKPPKRKGS